jgi:hypothetical protein
MVWFSKYAESQVVGACCNQDGFCPTHNNTLHLESRLWNSEVEYWKYMIL